MNATGTNGYELPTKIRSIVCAHLGLEVSAICQPTRRRELVNARQIAMYFIKKHTQLSLAEIGEYFPHPDHATVLHSIKKVNNCMDIYRDFRLEMETLDAKIRSMYNSEFKRYENYDTDKV